MSDCEGKWFFKRELDACKFVQLIFHVPTCLFVCFFVLVTCCILMALVYMDTKLLSFFN